MDGWHEIITKTNKMFALVYYLQDEICMTKQN
jgi:hypothetical protein